jgi:O-methyltransferase
MEPWVDLLNESDFLHWSRDDTIRENQMLRQAEKHKAFRLLFDMIAENKINGDYFEFGSHRVRTFRMALTEARKRDLAEMQFYAFDSFEGLPEDGSLGSQHPLWVKGALSTSEDDFKTIVQSHGIYVDRIHSVKGFYSDSLNAELEVRIKSTGRLASVICIDCDLYESAQAAFKFSSHFLQEGTVIYVDDLFAGYRSNLTKGVGKALLEFEKYIGDIGYSLISHMNVGWWGRTYIVISKE